MSVITNAASIARKYRARARALNALLLAGLRKAAALVDRKQVELLSGSGAPGSYPVPVRKGTLRGGHGWAIVGNIQAAVFNTATFAHVIHAGTGTSSKYGPREFLDDAGAAVDVAGVVGGDVRKGFVL